MNGNNQNDDLNVNNIWSDLQDTSKDPTSPVWANNNISGVSNSNYENSYSNNYQSQNLNNSTIVEEPKSEQPIINNIESNNNDLNRFDKSKKNNPIKIVLIILVAFIVGFVITKIVIALIINPIKNKKEFNDKKSDSKELSLKYIDSINNYVKAIENNRFYEVNIPKLSSGTVECYTSNGSTWYGDVDEKSITCDKYMKEIQKFSKVKFPEEAYIVLDSTGKVIEDTWIKYNGIYCMYDGNTINDYASKQPISIPDNPSTTSSGSYGVDVIIDAKESAARSSTLGFVDTIEFYAGFVEAGMIESSNENYNITIPTYKNGNVTCRLTNENLWTGDVDESSSTCDEFMKAVIKKSKGNIPTEAKIIIDTNGNVISGTWMKYNDYYCLYSNNSIGYCSKSKID